MIASYWIFPINMQTFCMCSHLENKIKPNFLNLSTHSSYLSISLLLFMENLF